MSDEELEAEADRLMAAHYEWKRSADMPGDRRRPGMRIIDGRLLFSAPIW